MICSTCNGTGDTGQNQHERIWDKCPVCEGMGEEMKTKEDIWREDIGLGYLFRISFDEMWLDFEVYRVIARDENKKYFHVKDHPVGCEMTEDTEKADVLSGYIKWDGCMEISRDERPHFCGIQDAAEELRVIEVLYKLAQEKMSHFDESCSGTDKYFQK